MLKLFLLFSVALFVTVTVATTVAAHTGSGLGLNYNWIQSQDGSTELFDPFSYEVRLD